MINVRTESQKEIETLPEVGPVIARRIINGQPYRSVDGLLRDDGIGMIRTPAISPSSVSPPPSGRWGSVGRSSPSPARGDGP